MLKKTQQQQQQQKYNTLKLKTPFRAFIRIRDFCYRSPMCYL